MKRFAVLALLAAFILGTVGVAQAVEIKAKGVWRVHFDYYPTTRPDPFFNENVKHDKYLASQRMRTIFEFVASENLKGVLQLEIGNLRWGGPGGGALNADGTNVKTKHAYLQFKLPSTDVDVKAGIQGVSLPSTLGSHILAADVGALVASVPFNDMVGLTLGYARPYDLFKITPTDPQFTMIDKIFAIASDGEVGATSQKFDDEVDVFMGILPVAMDGINLNPFVVYSRWGKDFTGYNKNANMWHAGLNFAVTMLDPIVIKGDFNYGTVKWDDNFKQSGWIADLAVEYKMDMVTPQVFFAYESGEGSDSSDSKRMPVIGNDGGAFGVGQATKWATSFADGTYVRTLLAELDPMSYQVREGAVGLWLAGAALRNITFMDDLSHELVFSYAKGTNDENSFAAMTKKDNFWEVDFNTKYQMYENLALILELTYLKVSLDDMGTGIRSDLTKDAMMKGTLGVVYSF
jgi:hypothetical protein